MFFVIWWIRVWIDHEKTKLVRITQTFCKIIYLGSNTSNNRQLYVFNHFQVPNIRQYLLTKLYHIILNICTVLKIFNSTQMDELERLK